MSIDTYNEASQLIKSHSHMCDFYGPCSEHLVQAAELALGLNLPETYRRFVLDYGSGSFGSTTIYGIVKEGFDNPGTPDVVWNTITTRRDVEMPPNYIIIYSVGDGEVFCLSVETPEVSPLIAYTPGLPIVLQSKEVISNDFSDFLLRQVQRNIAKQSHR
jgi:hypothetical protein